MQSVNAAFISLVPRCLKNQRLNNTLRIAISEGRWCMVHTQYTPCIAPYLFLVNLETSVTLTSVCLSVCRFLQSERCLPSTALHDQEAMKGMCKQPVPGAPSLGPRPPPFYLPFAFTIIHGSGRPAKNGEGLGAFIT